MDDNFKTLFISKSCLKMLEAAYMVTEAYNIDYDYDIDASIVPGKELPMRAQQCFDNAATELTHSIIRDLYDCIKAQDGF